MQTLTRPKKKELEIVEAEVIGSENGERINIARPKLTEHRRWLDGLAAAGILTLFGLGLATLGLFLTLSIIGAFIGIPLILAGVCSVLVAFLVLMDGKRRAQWSAYTVRVDMPQSRFSKN